MQSVPPSRTPARMAGCFAQLALLGVFAAVSVSGQALSPMQTPLSMQTFIPPSSSTRFTSTPDGNNREARVISEIFGVAALAGNSTPLYDGIPVTGSLASSGKWSQFTFSLRSNAFGDGSSSGIHVLLTPLSGNPDLYVNVGPNVGPPTSLSPSPMYSSTSLSSYDFVRIRVNDTLSGGPLGPSTCLSNSSSSNSSCTVFVGVYALRPCSFILSATAGYNSTSLISDVALVNELDSGNEVDYYLFPVLNASSRLVEVAVSPISSSIVVLLASDTKGTSKPDPRIPSSYCRAAVTSDNIGNGVRIAVAPDEVVAACWCTPPCNYYVAITGMGKADTGAIGPYVVVASENSQPITLLIDGTGFSTSNTYNNLDHYSFSAAFDPRTSSSTISKTIEFLIAPSAGTVALYVSVGQALATQTSYQYTTATADGASPQLLIVRWSDYDVQAECNSNGEYNATSDAPPPPCLLTLAVLITSPSASYTIMAQMTSYVKLSDSFAASEYSFPNQYSYFLFTATTQDKPVFIGVESTTGTAFAYLGSDAVVNTTMPTGSVNGSYVLKSENIDGTQSFLLRPGDQAYCNPTPTCSYYIGVTAVYGYDENRSTSFDIVALTVGRTLPLLLNAPIVGVVQPQSTVTYYLPWPGSSSTLTVSAAVVASGKIDARVLVWADINSTAPSIILPADAGNAQYLIDVGTGSVLITASDVAVVQACGNVTNQFPGSPRCFVSVTVFGNTFNTRAPDAIDIGDDSTLPVPATINFNIGAAVSPILLQDGITITQGGKANTYAVFRFIAVDATPILVALTPLSGDPDLFVGVGFIPNTTTSSYSSASAGAEIISITFPGGVPPSSAMTQNFPVDIFISVLSSNSIDSSFTLLASSNTVVPLAHATPTAGYVASGTFSYYSVFVQTPADDPSGSIGGLEIALISLSGVLPSFYVNALPDAGGVNPELPACGVGPGGGGTPFPNCGPPGEENIGPWQWSTMSPNPYQYVVRIDPSDLNYRSGVTYAIGVYAQSDAEQGAGYLLISSPLDSIKALPENLPMPGYALAGNISYYSFTIAAYYDVFISLTPAGGNPDMFVSLDANNTRPSPPFNYTFSATATDGIQDNIYIPAASLGETCAALFSVGSPCTAYIGVVASGNATAGAAWTLSASLLDNSTSTTGFLLVPGSPRIDMIPAGRPSRLYYREILLPPVNSSDTNPNAGTYLVTITSLRGSGTDIYATTDGSIPTSTSYQFAGETTGGNTDVIFISPSDPGYCSANCTLKIAVVCGVGACTYEIVLTFPGSGVPIRLTDHVPLAGIIAPGDYDYYVFSPSYAMGDIYVTSTGAGALEVDLFLSPLKLPWSNNPLYRPIPPNVCRNSTRKENNGGNSAENGILVLADGDPLDRCFCGSCNYLISVRCTDADWPSSSSSSPPFTPRTACAYSVVANPLSPLPPRPSSAPSIDNNNEADRGAVIGGGVGGGIFFVFICCLFFLRCVRSRAQNTKEHTTTTTTMGGDRWEGAGSGGGVVSSSASSPPLTAVGPTGGDASTQQARADRAAMLSGVQGVPVDGGKSTSPHLAAARAAFTARSVVVVQ